MGHSILRSQNIRLTGLRLVHNNQGAGNNRETRFALTLSQHCTEGESPVRVPNPSQHHHHHHTPHSCPHNTPIICGFPYAAATSYVFVHSLAACRPSSDSVHHPCDLTRPHSAAAQRLCLAQALAIRATRGDTQAGTSSAKRLELSSYTRPC